MEGRESKKSSKKAANQLIPWRGEKVRKLSKNQQINKFDGGQRKQEISERSNKSTNLIEGRESQKTLKEATNQQISWRAEKARNKFDG